MASSVIIMCYQNQNMSPAMRTKADKDMDKAREILVQSLRHHRISEPVLEAMRKVPRHLFVSESLWSQAYRDHPLPIGNGQTISAPHMVAMMCDLMDLKPGDNVLEIGAGSGYNAAVMAELIVPEGHIHTIERIPSLAENARTNLDRAGYTENITVHTGDGTLGLPKHAPYDSISVTCAAPDTPPPLVEQLADGGRILIPIGRGFQDLYIVEKKGKKVTRKRVTSVVFVPLIGKYGF